MQKENIMDEWWEAGNETHSLGGPQDPLLVRGSKIVII